MPGFLTDAEMADLEKDEVGFISDEDMERLEKGNRDYAQQGADLLTRAGRGIASGVAAASSAVDRFTGAPIRAAVGAFQDDKPILPAFANQFLRPADTAPTGKELAEKAGISSKEFDIPLVANPFTNEKVKASPSGIVGGIAEAATDPLTYVPGRIVAKGLEKGAQGVSRMSPKVAEYLSNVAAERAVKAGTGQNVRALRKLAKVNPQGAGDISKAVDNIRSAGRQMLSADEAGAPVVGWFSTSRDIGERSAAKKGYYGRQIGEAGKAVDDLIPEGSVIGPELAAEMRAYGESITNAGKGAAVRNQVAKEAENVEDMGQMSFARAQDLKQQYPYEPQAADALISSRDASNELRSIVGRAQDEAVEKAKIGRREKTIAQPQITDNAALSGRPQERVVAPTLDQQLALAKYGPAKDKYGLYKDISQAGTDRAIKDLSNRFVSPSSHAVGGTATVAATDAFDDLKKGGIVGMAAGLANQLALSRGSAFAARSANALSKAFMAAPEKYAKWMPTLQTAAKRGNEALVITHHLLVKNDPEYRRIIEEEGASE